MVIIRPRAGPTTWRSPWPAAASRVRAQTFTAGVTDTLAHVDVLVRRDASTTGALQVEIWATSGGLPTGPPPSSAAVPAASVPVSPPGWVSVPLSGPPLLSGNQYAIVVYALTSANGSFYWTHSSANQLPPGPIDLYPADELFFRPFGTGTFGGPFPPADFAFRTFVGPPAPTMPMSKDDCKEGRWKRYAVFKNQGDCVSWAQRALMRTVVALGFARESGSGFISGKEAHREPRRGAIRGSMLSRSGPI